jgi:D-serine deaminase-like pyridoxal phosphate-dependent protein
MLNRNSPPRDPIRGPNAGLIGQPGGRWALDTPALLVDRDALMRNLAAMAAHARAVGVALRPHAKTHKSLTIARLQVEAGAIGISCATLGEAEVMIAGGLPGVHITSPQVTPAKLARLGSLKRSDHRGLSVVVDHPDNLKDLAAAADGDGKPLDVLIDFAAGHARTGCADPEAVLALARAAQAAPALRLLGIQSYSGQLQHIATRAARRDQALRQADILRAILHRLRAEGIAAPVVTGGGTGTFDLDPEARVFTELQTGSYVFMDVDYQRALQDGRNTPPFETSLFVQSAVVSVNAPGYVTTDAGLKSFATDGPLPVVAKGAAPGSRYEFFGDEHGKLFVSPGETRPALGARIECVVPHCDPTANLHDVFHVVSGDTLVDIWPIEARGKR